jgi:hypothetical protein
LTNKRDNLGRAIAEQSFRYWVEIRDLANGSVRNLPLLAVARVHIPRGKREAQKPTEEALQLKDGPATLEASNLEDLAAQLRARYPDCAYARALHQERDLDAVERRSKAINGLINLIVESFVRSLSIDDAAALSAWIKTREGKRALRESWPNIVEAYFHLLCNPKR